MYGRARSLVSVSRSLEFDYRVVRVRLCAIYTPLAIVFRFTSQSPERGRAVVCGLTFGENPPRWLIIINFRGFISSRISCLCVCVWGVWSTGAINNSTNYRVCALANNKKKVRRSSNRHRPLVAASVRLSPAAQLKHVRHGVCRTQSERSTPRA